MTRKDYMDGKVSFEEYYRSVARAAGISFASASVGLLDRVERALAAGDKHLNTIPLSLWDSYAIVAQHATAPAFKAHGDGWSLAGGVCVAKQAAKDAAVARRSRQAS